MGKPFKTLDEQVEILKNRKNVIIDNNNEAKYFLLDNNYYNVISSTKIFFSYDYCHKQKKHKYNQTHFNDWVDYYIKEQNLSYIVFRYIGLIEKQINSRLAYIVSKMIEDNVLDPKELIIIKNSIMKTIRKDCVLPEYSFDETWVYITNFTFGNTGYLIKKLKGLIRYRKKNKLDHGTLGNYLKAILSVKSNILMTASNLDYLIELRNYTGHNIPLNIFVTSGATKNDMRKRIYLLEQVAKESDSRQSVHTFIKDMKKATLKYVGFRY